jgi:DNA-binding HxlR family transcriptional regulator
MCSASSTHMLRAGSAQRLIVDELHPPPRVWGLSGDVDRLFEVISHRVRRSIIESIAEKGPRSFTELMEDTGVGDTGTLTFHLRKMAGFIRKNERGDYELTDLGRRAYELIKIAYGGLNLGVRSPEPGLSKLPGALRAWSPI